MEKVIVTTSWDDGSVYDLRLLTLLEKYNLRGTFYISKSVRKKAKINNYGLLSSEDIIKISKTQEIGAHTISHPDLDKISIADAHREIDESKKWLEGLIQKPIKSFAYPRGIYNNQVVEIVKRLGFVYARTTIRSQIDIGNPLASGLTLKCYPVFPKNKDWGIIMRLKIICKNLRRNYLVAIKFKVSIFCIFNWNVFAEKIFDSILKTGGIFHLSGHSWEIEKYNMWDKLDKFFAYISHRKDILYLTNSEILEYYDE